MDEVWQRLLQKLNTTGVQTRNSYLGTMSYIVDAILAVILSVDKLQKKDPTFLEKTSNGSVMNKNKMNRLVSEIRNTEFVGLSVSLNSGRASNKCTKWARGRELGGERNFKSRYTRSVIFLN